MTSKISRKSHAHTNAVLVLADGTCFFGKGIGKIGTATGEICFNTSMTGYQEIITDPSYAGQIITFTFPHIGNTGTTIHDNESIKPASKGIIIGTDITSPSNWRSTQSFQSWLADQELTGICDIDTRALTNYLRDHGAQNGLIFYAQNQDEMLDLETLRAQAAAIPSMEGQDLAKTVTCHETYTWDEAIFDLDQNEKTHNLHEHHHIVAMDFGAKHNILRCLANTGAKVTIVPAHTSAKEILELHPDGIFLSNGPGDPKATGAYVIPVLQELLKTGIPMFGICLGHQMLALAMGADTVKMDFGHRGGNHPVKDLHTGKIDITSQNHGFCVVEDSLPDHIEATHISLFDQSNEGLRILGQNAFSVQFHPEASPGPEDSHYLFDQFINMIQQSKIQSA